MDLTDLLQFAAPGSFSRVVRFDENDSDLWVFNSEAELQAALDACVTWRDAPVPAATIWPQVGAFNIIETQRASPEAKQAALLEARRAMVDYYLDENEAISALIESVIEGAVNKEEARINAKAKIV